MAKGNKTNFSAWKIIHSLTCSSDMKQRSSICDDSYNVIIFSAFKNNVRIYCIKKQII